MPERRRKRWREEHIEILTHPPLLSPYHTPHRNHSKTYREQSRRVKKDVTCGIAAAAARAFDISPWEVEATEEFMWESRAGLP